MIGVLTALPFVLFYWIARAVARRRLASLFRTPRAWQPGTLQAWVEQGWLDREAMGALPQQLSPSVVFYEWGGADPEAARHWRFRERAAPATPVEAMVRDAWAQLPPDVADRSRQRVAAAVVSTAAWWGNDDEGWNGRPFVLPAAAVPRKQAALPLLPLEDLTAEPLPGPWRVEKLARESEGPDLVLALAGLRRMSPRFVHPLASRADPTVSMVEGLSTRVATDLGRRLGAGLGAALGPLGAMVGQYLGELAGTVGGKALAQQALPEAVAGPIRGAETALARLGQLAESEALTKAAKLPAKAILAAGRRLEAVRAVRSRRLRERVWPTAGLVAVEETLRVALAELQAYRAAADAFLSAARQSPATMAGSMLLQNPWLIPALPGGGERLAAARAALSRAAAAISRG
jgi:hypothetical protein